MAPFALQILLPILIIFAEFFREKASSPKAKIAHIVILAGSTLILLVSSAPQIKGAKAYYLYRTQPKVQGFRNTNDLLDDINHSYFSSTTTKYEQARLLIQVSKYTTQISEWHYSREKAKELLNDLAQTNYAAYEPIAYSLVLKREEGVAWDEINTQAIELRADLESGNLVTLRGERLTNQDKSSIYCVLASIWASPENPLKDTQLGYELAKTAETFSDNSPRVKATILQSRLEASFDKSNRHRAEHLSEALNETLAFFGANHGAFNSDEIYLHRYYCFVRCLMNDEAHLVNIPIDELQKNRNSAIVWADYICDSKTIAPDADLYLVIAELSLLMDEHNTARKAVRRCESMEFRFSGQMKTRLDDCRFGLRLAAGPAK